MPAYNTFNLATQGRNGQTPNITTNYYSGLNRPNPIGNQLGNQSGTGTGTAVNPQPTPAPNAGGAWTQGQDAIPYLQQFLGNRNPNGTSGFNLENAFGSGTAGNGYDPRLYNYGLTRTQMSEGGDNYSFTGNTRVNPRGLIVHNGQEYAQAGEFLDRIIDPSQVIYDDEFGVLTPPGNINNPESHLTRAMPYIVAAGLGGVVAGAAGGFGAAGEAGGVYGGMQGTGGGAFADWAAPTLAETAGATGTTAGATTVAGPGSTMGPVTGPVGYEGAGAAATAAGGGGAGSSLPFGLTGADLATGASALYNVINSRNVRNDANAAADRADPYGPRRPAAGEALDNFMRDPNYIYQRPGYLARQAQGEQSINRAAAGKGYFRSPNMLFDLSKFNSGLAAQEFDAEYKRLAEMAGVSINPGTAATIQANGNQASTNMRSAGITQAGSVFFDWLSRQG